MPESAELSSRREVVAHVDDEPEQLVDHDQMPEPEADYADELEYDAAAAETVRYRKGRGGFDPEAAELAARAKYAFRQRVVLALLATMVISAVLAGFVLPALWWVTGAAATGLAGYLGYLRRQVRIEESIRERRLARQQGARSVARRRRVAEDDLEDERDYEMLDEEPMTLRGVERKPRPHSRLPRRNAVVVDIDDEDPAFHELDEPGPPVYRRAVGE